MKRSLILTILWMLLACAPAVRTASADATPAPDGEPAASPVPASDGIHRAQLRLVELGYLLTPVSGVSDEAYVAALAAFCKENGLSKDAEPNAINAVLFSAQARPAPFRTAAVSLGRGLDDTPFLTGLALSWVDVKPRLTPGEVYALTSCTSGIQFRMRYLAGNGHAELSPELSWDDATLFSLLSGNSARKMPVVVSIGGLRIAASIALNSDEPAQEDGMHRYCLHFAGSTSDLGEIVDAEHQYLIQYATDAGTDAAMPDDGAAAQTTAAPNIAETPDPGENAADAYIAPDDADDWDDMPADDSD